MNGTHQGSYPGVVFFPGPSFDAAANIDSIGPGHANGGGDIFGRQAAGEEDAVAFCGAAGDLPIEGLAGAAAAAASERVEQDGVRRAKRQQAARPETISERAQP